MFFTSVVELAPITDHPHTSHPDHMKGSDITINLQLDENQVPERIVWNAEGGAGNGVGKAMLLSFWDAEELNTMRIDLWTKEMTTDEMKAFVHQNLLTLSDTFERATNEGKMAEQMRDFAAYFAEHMLPDLKKK